MGSCQILRMPVISEGAENGETRFWLDYRGFGAEFWILVCHPCRYDAEKRPKNTSRANIVTWHSMSKRFILRADHAHARAHHATTRKLHGQMRTHFVSVLPNFPFKFFIFLRSELFAPVVLLCRQLRSYGKTMDVTSVNKE